MTPPNEPIADQQPFVAAPPAAPAIAAPATAPTDPFDRTDRVSA
jgi:hypothetical protein